jgi:hypothetical protein
MDLKVLLLDADDDWGINEQGKGVDATALRVFPPTLEELNKYDVIIIGDCDPKHQKLATRLTDIALFVKGEKPGGTKGEKPGGGILFMAGASYNPHRYKGTPLADVMPVEPTQDAPPPEVLHKEPWRPKLTALGKIHPMFRFGPDQNESVNIFDGLQKIYWHTSRYRIKPLAEVLAVHPTEKAQLPLQPGQDPNHPLVVQQFVGTGRSMFFGFDETWRWRFREHESKYNTFWIQSMRYLSRGRLNRTELKLDRQTPYKVGDDIKVTVTFPDSASSGGGKPGPKIDAKTKPEVTVIHLPLDAKEKVGAKLPTMKLDKVKGSFGQFEGTLPKVQEGKYRFRLTDPDVSESQPDKQKPTAEATVELPPGELDKLRMDYQEMEKAAALSNGAFYKLANCDQLLEELPPGGTIPIPLPVPPTLLWNQWWVFVLIVLLITSEWVLRKMKHLL